MFLDTILCQSQTQGGRRARPWHYTREYSLRYSRILLCGYPRLIGLILRIGYSRERERDGAFKLRD